jgi:hypothetical protein
MLTSDQVRRLSEDFYNAYPEELPDRLQWCVDQLGIRARPVMRLMGIPAAEAEERSRTDPIDWEAVVEKVGEQAAFWMEALIFRIFSWWHYDLEECRADLRQTVPEKVPILVAGGTEVWLSEVPEADREEVLLQAIIQRSPYALLSLKAILRPQD